MTASFARRLLPPLPLLSALGRSALAAAVLVLLVEGARLASGEPGSAALALLDPGASSPPELGSRPWGELLADRALRSARPFALAWGAALLTGVAWGILAGPWERRGAFRVLAAPFQLGSCVPGFWFATAAAAFAYFRWDRPGFADELSVESGPDLVAWWNAAVVALPAAVLAAGAHFQHLGRAYRGAGRSPMARGLRLAGTPGERIHYRFLLRGRLADYAKLPDNALGALLGALVFTEWALRYEGLGALLVDCARLGAWPGLLATGLAAVALTAFLALLREVAEALLGGVPGGSRHEPEREWH